VEIVAALGARKGLSLEALLPLPTKSETPLIF